MLYKNLADYYEKLESTSKKLEKAEILSELYSKTPDKILPKLVLLSMGTVYIQGESELGVASELVKRIIEKTFGVSGHEVEKKFKETGDLGLTAEFFIIHRRQLTLARRELTVETVFENLRKLPEVSGSGSQDKKIALVAELLSQASGKEARYLVRTVLGEMRIGVAAGIVRDAIARAFGQEKKEVEHVYDILGDYGRVAEMAKRGNLKVELEVGYPLRVMLADRAKNLKEALEKFEKPCIEMKMDGFRAQIHKKGKQVKIFSRRMDDVTRQFPEVADWTRESVKAAEAIIEGEILSVTKDGKPKPFQVLSRRIQRKYEIERMVREIPVRIDLFDIIFLNGKNLMHEPLRRRWEILGKTIEPLKAKFVLVEHIETRDLEKAEKFYQQCLSMGEEGVIVKNMNAQYQPGRRVGYWLKVKPIMEPLDLVITGATWGEGKRASWLGSLVISARDSGGRFLPTGMLGSGLTEEQMEDLTRKLKKLITEEKGRNVTIKPKIVLEVAYEEIQKSQKYESGYALRFPRLIRLREDDKKPEDADTLATMEKLFRQQRARK
jgi:DNA ligase-1